MKKKRNFLPEQLDVSQWNSIEIYISELHSRDLAGGRDVEKWLQDYSELHAAIYEYRAWCFINMTRNTRDENAALKWQELMGNLMPEIYKAEDLLMRKLSQSEGFQFLEEPEFAVLKAIVYNSIEIYREKNVVLFTEIQTLSREYDNFASGMDIDLEGEKFPIAVAGRILESKDRERREMVWKKITARRQQEIEKLDKLFDALVALRTQVAKNAGYDSFTDFAYKLLGRFDYDRKDAYSFHNSVEKVIRPLYEKIMLARKKQLNVEHLMIWDVVVDPTGGEPLNPFRNADDLIQQSKIMLGHLNPEIGELVKKLEEMGHLDLDARLGKAPGGYSYILPESQLPFVFMNAAGSQSDLTTMIHEMGHAMHAWVSRDQWLFTHLSLPSEIAEFASMGLELLSLDHWGIFYSDPKDLSRARKEQLLRPITLLPWIAAIDLFQHWVYDHPNHSREERNCEWKKIYTRFHGEIVEWHDDDSIESFWQKQGHLFDSPFYYIEYGIAQLGAISLWRNFKINPVEGMKNYLSALSMGYALHIPEVYKAADIRFNFSEDYIRELSSFLESEISKLEE